HQRQLRDSGDLYTEDVRTLLEVGELILATDYVKALRTRALIKNAWREMFDGLDAVLAPTLPTVASRVGQRVVSWPDGTEEEITSSHVRLCVPGNLTGLPALSLPCGTDSAGLPIGLQILGRPFDEPTVLRIGAAYEQVSPAAGSTPVTPPVTG